jgi:phosphate uptake regulator
MLRELLSLFGSNDAITRMSENFSRMLELSRDVTLEAGTSFFDTTPTADERTSIYKRDVKINKLERRIRKQVIAHLTVGRAERDAPYCLLLMSLVKDVERIGDYAKNLVEIYEDGGGPLPGDQIEAELREIRAIVEETSHAVGGVFSQSDTEAALDLTRRGREVNHRCDALLTRVAKSDYDAATTTTLILATRYYKRIESHLLNILSGVVMPLHKLDYYDEDVLPKDLKD